uniref:Neurocan n=1 Tax=Aotus nancymaae TaxID=37293 RepID=A0A2K5EUS4_AOTNA
YVGPARRLTLAGARAQCRRQGAALASVGQLHLAWHEGLDQCDPGWLADGSVRYPIQTPRRRCGGPAPGVRTVYRFANRTGEVFYVGPARRLTLAGARAQCRRQGAALASVGQLHLAWHEGLDQCDPGWLADGSVRYPIQTPRRRCGGPAPGVRTVYRFANRTGFPSPAARFDAYCFRAHHPTSQHGDLESPSSGDEGEIVSAEGPPVRELEPTLEEAEVVTSDFQEPLVSSGEEEPLILAEKQESQQTLSPTPGEPMLASWPTGEVWQSTVAPSPSDMGADTAAGSHTEVAPTGPTPRRMGRFKGLNGRYFQQQEPEPGLQAEMEAGAQPPTPEAAGNHVEPPLAVTEMLGSGRNQSPWADLTNEVDMPGAGSAGGKSSPEPWLWPPTVVPPSISGQSRAPVLELEKAEGPSVRPVTPDLSWPPSEATVPAPGPAPWEASPVLPSPDLPIMAMLLGPKQWLLPFSTPTSTEADRVEGHAPLDPCENNPCLHGGTCNTNGTMYGCSCDQGFAGENCEIDIDDCLCSPCENGGTCIDEVNGFVCLCLPSYGGSLCEKDTEGCDRGWHKFQGHCYRYFAHRRAWEDAERDCRRRAGHLTSVHSPEEHSFINSFGHENTWIGLNDRIVERDFQWTDNTGLNQPEHSSLCVCCGAAPPAVENASLIGAHKAKYNVHATVRYQCDEGFAQHHVATIRCRSNGKWDRPQIVCTKPRRSHRMRRHHHHHQRHHQHHHHKSRKERRKHKKQPTEDWEKDEGNFC